MEPTVARSQIGRFGITGDAQTAQMKNLSDGQKSRVSCSGGAVLIGCLCRVTVCVVLGCVLVDRGEEAASAAAGRAHKSLGP